MHWLYVTDVQGSIMSEVWQIVELIAAHDAVLAAGHISSRESLALLKVAQNTGVKRMVVTYASQSVSDMPIEDLKKAVDLGR